MKSRSLQSKLFFAYISLACLILFSFAVFFYAFVSRQLKQSQISAMNTLNSSFQTQVDSAIRNLDAVSVNINYSNQSKTILDNSFNLNISSNMLSAMSDLFISLSGTELKADQVNLYDFSGYVLEAGISTIVKKTDGSKDEWIEVARELEGKKVLTPPYCTREYTKTATYDQWFISLYRSFNNQYKRGVGVIETAKQCKSVFKSIITYKKKNHEDAASIYVFDSNGDLIYPYDISQEYKAALQPYYELTKGDDSALTFISPLTGKTEQDAKIAGIAHEKGKGVIIAVNKWDAIEKNDKTIYKHTNRIREVLSFMPYAEIVFISARTGLRISRMFETLDAVIENQTMRIQTGVLNEILAEAVAMQQPPSDRGRRLKIFYMTQVAVKPPTFVIFVNDKELMHFSYTRYLENKIRDAFDFGGTPLKFIVRERGEKE